MKSRNVMLLTAIIAVSAGAVQAAPLYTAVDLTSLGGTYEALAVNNAGVAVGYNYLGNSSLLAFGINNAGEVVGHDYGSPGTGAFYWLNGTKYVLPGVSGYSNNNALGINDSGQIVGDGYSGNLGQQSQAVTWENGQLTELPTILGGSNSAAYGINNGGQIVGFSSVASNNNFQVATLWSSSGAVTELTSLGGNQSQALAINNNGQVVGFSSNTLENYQAVIWSNGSIEDLGTLGGDESVSDAINNSGEVVGYANTEGNTEEDFIESSDAFLWTAETGMLDLNSLVNLSAGWQLYQAYGVNDQGQIITDGYNTITNTYAAFLLDPIDVPEPSSIFLFGAGVFGLAFWRRRARR